MPDSVDEQVFNRILAELPEEFSIHRIREKYKAAGLKPPQRIGERLLDRGYRKSKIGYRSPAVPNKRWDTPIVTRTSRLDEKDSRN